MRKEERLLEFLDYVSRMDVVDFYGVCKILKVETSPEMEFEEALSEIIDKFVSLGRNQERDLLKVIHLAASPVETNKKIKTKKGD